MTQSDADITFLALFNYREFRSELALYPAAVIAGSYVIMTRVKEDGWEGTDVMSVLFHPEQVSSFTSKGDLELTVWPASGDPVWQDCLTIAEQVYNGSTANPCPTADHYYAVTIPPPSWATPAGFIRQIGKTRFYKTR